MKKTFILVLFFLFSTGMYSQYNQQLRMTQQIQQQQFQFQRQAMMAHQNFMQQSQMWNFRQIHNYHRTLESIVYGLNKKKTRLESKNAKLALQISELQEELRLNPTDTKIQDKTEKLNAKIAKNQLKITENQSKIDKANEQIVTLEANKKDKEAKKAE